MNSRRLGGNPVYPKDAGERASRLENSVAFGGKAVPMRKARPKSKVQESTYKKQSMKIHQLRT